MKTHMPMRGFAAAGEGNVLYRSDICGGRSDRTRSLFGTALAAATLGASVITGCASTQGVVIEGDVASTGLPSHNLQTWPDGLPKTRGWAGHSSTILGCPRE